MISAIVKRLPRAPSTIAAVIVLLLIGFFAFLSWGLSASDDTFVPLGGERVELDSYRSLRVGTSREEVERRVGSGLDALEFGQTGSALEPADAECVYYSQAGTGNLRDIFQLCFQDDTLISKQAYAAAPGPPLIG